MTAGSEYWKCHVCNKDRPAARMFNALVCKLCHTRPTYSCGGCGKTYRPTAGNYSFGRCPGCR